MDQNTCANKIAADLADVGISRGDTILVHSSFKSLGEVPGGIETVILGLLQAVGAEGTLLMPALSYRIKPSETYDPQLTPSIVGAIPDYFRRRPGTLRSIHPTHSVCAVGRRAHELLDEHWLDCTPCGAHSPFHKIVESQGKILMLGCGLQSNTTMHALEEYVEPPYLYGNNAVYTIRNHQGEVYQKEYKTHGFDLHGYHHRYDHVMELDTRTFLRQGRVLQAEVFVMDATALKKAVVEKLRENPFFFVEAISNKPACEGAAE